MLYLGSLYGVSKVGNATPFPFSNLPLWQVILPEDCEGLGLRKQETRHEIDNTTNLPPQKSTMPMFRHLRGKTAFNWCLADTEATKCRKCPGPAPMPPQTTRATEAPLDVSKLVAIGSQFQGSGTCIWRWHAAAVNQGSLFGLPDEASLELRRFLKVSLKYSSKI